MPENVALGAGDGLGKVGAPQNITQTQQSLANHPDAQIRAFFGEAEDFGFGDGVARIAGDADGDQVISPDVRILRVRGADQGCYQG